MASCICGRPKDKDVKQRRKQENGNSIICHNCQRSIHLECANLQSYQIEELQIFYCPICQPYTGPPVSKVATNSHRHNRYADNPENLPIQTGTPDFINYMKKCTSINDARPNDFKKMRGQQLTFKELIISGFDKPILVESINGLEMSIDNELNFDNLLEYFDNNDLLINDAMEVTRQIKVQIKLSNLIAQFQLNQEGRQDIYSVRINMVKNLKKHENFSPPRIVQRLSWIDMYWPDVSFKPLLSKYLFLSMKNSYEDYHINIGGSSSWYHLIKGEQIFYLVEPTKNSLDYFETWSKSENIHELMLYKNVENIFKIKVTQGQTIFIPNGWIYSVLTLQDTISFGGYFLHSLNISKQLFIYDFLKKLDRDDLNFPAYELINWYAAPNILKLTKESLKNQPPKHILIGIEALVEKLKFWLQKSKCKRSNNEQQQHLVPKAVNCSKIIRDLNRCLIKKKKRLSSIDQQMKKMKLQQQQQQNKDQQTSLPLNPEEAKIKDLVDADPNSNLKIKFNIKLAQDVLRKSLDDQHDVNNDQNGKQKQTLLESKSSTSNYANYNYKKKLLLQQHREEMELNKILKQSKKTDGDYIYYDVEPDDNSKSSKKGSSSTTNNRNNKDDEVWEPSNSNSTSTSSGINKSNKKQSSKSKNEKQSQPQSSSTNTTTSTASISSTNSSNLEASVSGGDQSACKKHKKGLATPKQRLAKKLRMSM